MILYNNRVLSLLFSSRVKGEVVMRCVCLCVCVIAAKSSAASGGFGTVSSHGSREGPPALAGLFSGGMPQLRSRGGASVHSPAVASQSDSSASVSGRPGLYSYCHKNPKHTGTDCSTRSFVHSSSLSGYWLVLALNLNLHLYITVSDTTCPSVLLVASAVQFR